MWLDLSIIMPCYNEGSSIRENMIKLAKYMNKEFRDYTYEMIIVNDGSTDLTKRLITAAKKQIEDNFEFSNLREIKLINYTPNRGKGCAIRKGIEKASGNYILFMDADLSTALSDINKFWINRDKADIIIGNRKSNQSTVTNKSLKRKIVSFACNIITKLIVPINYKDTQCGFKFFKRNIARAIARDQKIAGFAFDVEYLYIAKLRKYKVLELPVRWNDRRDSKVKLSKSSRDFFRDLIRIRLNRISYIR